MRLRSRISIVTACLAAVIAQGCGPSEPSATVSGSVVSDGKPAPNGSVMFEGAGRVCVGVIVEGKYSLKYGGEPNIPLGHYAVTVLPPSMPPVIDLVTSEMRSPPGAEPTWLAPRYRLAETSGLAFNVVKGENEYNIALTTAADE